MNSSRGNIPPALGLTKEEILERCQKAGGLTPEVLADILAENNEKIRNAVNKILSSTHVEC